MSTLGRICSLALVAASLAYGWAYAQSNVTLSLSGAPLAVVRAGLLEFDRLGLRELEEYQVTVIEREVTYLVIFEDRSFVGMEGSGPRLGVETELAKRDLSVLGTSWLR